MATRSGGGGGMGVMVALVIFILASIALLLTTLLFYTKMEQARTNEQQAIADSEEFIKDAERNRDEFVRLKSVAQREGKSVVGYLRDEYRAVMQKSAGSRDVTRQALESQAVSLEVPEGESLLGEIRRLTGLYRAEEQSRKDLYEEQKVLQARLEDEVERRRNMENSHQTTIAELQNEIDLIEGRANDYARRVEEAEQNMRDRVTQIRDQYENEIADLRSELELSRAEVDNLEEANRQLGVIIKGIRVGSTDEANLADGEVLRVMDGNNVFIDLGRDKKVVLGMTFDVYNDVTELRRDAGGNIPRGKAVIEIIRIDDTTSTARVIRSTAGQPVVDGDIIVNPIYDPDKTYSFFVFGDFDLDAEEGPSNRETMIVRSRIEEWGGVIRDEFAGDVDYLVLGQEPIVPIQPPAGSPPAMIREYVRQRQFYQQYQDYLQRAADLSIPVLNQNRLLTLIGYYGP